jgi:transcriptional regulator with XRE-family HTH domain
MDSIYEYVLDRLQAAKGGWPTVANEAGISLRTLEKIARKETKDPSVRHIEKLANYFRGQAKRSASRLPA